MTLVKPKRRGHITKEGRRDLRGVMVEAAWVAVEHHPHWKAQFERLTKRIGKQKAIVAIARKLLVAVWHVLAEQQADTNAEVQAVARKLMNWITYHGVIPGQHRDRLLLLYQHLDELGLSDELEEIDYYGTTYRLSVRQKLLREARDVEALLRLASGCHEVTTSLPHVARLEREKASESVKSCHSDQEESLGSSICAEGCLSIPSVPSSQERGRCRP